MFHSYLAIYNFHICEINFHKICNMCSYFCNELVSSIVTTWIVETCLLVTENRIISKFKIPLTSKHFFHRLKFYISATNYPNQLWL